MIIRWQRARIAELLSRWPAVILLGPRQVGKRTLAMDLAGSLPADYLDLESPSDQAKLADPELFLRTREDRLVILDEVQRQPELFPALRGLIDEGKRRGRGTARFLLLGSSSLDLFRHVAESLAGRSVDVELTPVTALELDDAATQRDRLWLRGGFPNSLLAANDALSLEWRRAFMRTYLERDIPQLAPRLPAETLRRFWTMLAHLQGSPLNAAKLAAGLGVSGQTVARYLDLLTDLLLVRRLTPWTTNLGKRLVRTPKVYVRDSGLVHALLGLEGLDDLLGHPVVGPSWEGFVIETLLAVAPPGCDAFFYGTSAGAEIDLLLTLPGGRKWAVEIKRSLAPRPTRGFHHACEDLTPDARWVVYPGDERFPLLEEVQAVGLWELATELRQLGADAGE